MQITAEVPETLNTRWQLPPQLTVFTGREDQLKILEQSFSDRNQNMVIHQAEKISGTGGIGKTQLAVELAYRLSDILNAGENSV